MRTFLAGFAIVLGVVAVALAGGYFFTLPTTLKLAVPKYDTASKRLFEAAADQFSEQRRPLRIEVVSAPDARAALAMVEQGKADLAVARSDEVLRAKVQTALIVRQEGPVFLAPKSGKIKKLSDFTGGSVGVVREGPGSVATMQAVLDYYSLDINKIRPMPLSAAEVGPALTDKKVDLLIVVGNPASKPVSDAVAAARRIRGGIAFLEVEAADAIVQRMPELESIEIKQGLFGGRPAQPPEAVTTVGYSVRLVANERISDDRMSDLLRQFVRIRQSLAATQPGAGLIKLPDTDEEKTFVLHPGVLTYGSGEQKTFFDLYSDWIYVGTLLSSAVGSCIAAVFSRFGAARRQRAVSLIFELERLMGEIDTAGDLATLDAKARRIDEIFHAALEQTANGDFDGSGISAFQMVLAEARDRLERRRAAIAGRVGAVAAAAS